jgi:hypothetical protein
VSKDAAWARAASRLCSRTSSLSLLLCHPNSEATCLVVIDEVDTGLFERCLNFQESRNISRKGPLLAFNAPNGCNANLSRLGNVLLAPAEKRPGCPELCHLKHAPGELFDSSSLTRLLFFISYVLSKLATMG